MRNADRETLIHEIEEFLKEEEGAQEDVEESYIVILSQVGHTLLNATKNEVLLSIQKKCFDFIEENLEAGDNFEDDPGLLLAIEIGELTQEIITE